MSCRPKSGSDSSTTDSRNSIRPHPDNFRGDRRRNSLAHRASFRAGESSRVVPRKVSPTAPKNFPAGEKDFALPKDLDRSAFSNYSNSSNRFKRGVLSLTFSNGYNNFSNFQRLHPEG